MQGAMGGISARICEVFVGNWLGEAGVRSLTVERASFRSVPRCREELRRVSIAVLGEIAEKLMQSRDVLVLHHAQ